MHKYKTQLMKYFGKYSKMSDALETIKADLRKVKEAHKNDYFPEASPELLEDSLSDEEFMEEYIETIKHSFPDELAEVVTKMIDLAEAFDYNIFDYIKIRDRYCQIKQDWAVAQLDKSHVESGERHESSEGQYNTVSKYERGGRTGRENIGRGESPSSSGASVSYERGNRSRGRRSENQAKTTLTKYRIM